MFEKNNLFIFVIFIVGVAPTAVCKTGYYIQIGTWSAGINRCSSLGALNLFILIFTTIFPAFPILKLLAKVHIQMST